jgi:hypothetical protein
VCGVVWVDQGRDEPTRLEHATFDRNLGGVPKTLVIDNLRAAVTRADCYEPEIDAEVAEFCQLPRRGDSARAPGDAPSTRARWRRA